MDWGAAIIWIIIVVLGTIVVQYLFNPYFHKLGLSKKDEEPPYEKTEEEKQKEEEFYREIWHAKKRKKNL